MEQEGATMAQEGIEHWQRAVRWTFAGIFVAALAGGLVGQITRGSGLPTAAGHPQQGTALAAGASVPASRSGTVSPVDAARGATALVQLTDLPAGWSSGQPPSGPTKVSPWSSRLAGCIGIPSKIAAVAPTKVDSPDFTSSDKVYAIEDSVSVFPSASVANAEYAAMADSRTVGCMNKDAGSTLQSTMQQAAGSGTTVGGVTFTALPAAAAADHLAGFSVIIPIARSGRVLMVMSTQVDFVSGALVHQITFNGNGAAFPAQLEEEVLSAAQARH
jgi:hypothetical protein